MQSISKYHIIRLVLGFFVVGLIAIAIVLEVLPEDEAKVYVIPTLVAALFAGITQTSVFRKY